MASGNVDKIRTNLCFLNENLSPVDVQLIADKFLKPEANKGSKFSHVMSCLMSNINAEVDKSELYTNVLEFIKNECLKTRVVTVLTPSAATVFKTDTNPEFNEILDLATGKTLTVNLLGRILLRVSSEGWEPAAKELDVTDEDFDKWKKIYSVNELLYKISVFDVWRKREGFGEGGLTRLLVALKRCQQCIVDWESVRKLLANTKIETVQ